MATFGPGEANETILTEAGSGDIFVAKYNSNGVLVWAKRAGGPGSDVANGIAADVSGNSYITGSFGHSLNSPQSATFGAAEPNQTTLTPAGKNDIFVVKYDPNGLLLWAKRAGGTSGEIGWGIAVDGSGNSYVTGNFGLWDNGTDSATFGSGESNQTILTSAGNFDIFLAKYAPNGSLLWAKRAGGTRRDHGEDLALDASGNSCVTGIFGGTATFGPGEANETTLTSAGGETFYIAKYNSSGALAWAKQTGGPDDNEGFGIAVDSSHNSYVTGAFRGTATFGPGEANEMTLTSAPADEFDIFVAKYDSNGALKWAKRAGGSSVDGGTSIAVDGSGNSYVTGWFFDSATFGMGESNETTLTTAGFSDIFVAKFSAGNKTPADFDGDGLADIAVYQTSTGNWFYVGSTSGFGSHLAFGGANFLTVQADYDADGLTDTAVYDTTNGNWFINQTTAGFTVQPSFGGPGFIPVPGDYDGDGKTDVGVYELSTGHWFYVGSSSGFGQHLAFGGSGFVPVPGDYDGDGQTVTAVYQTSTGNWFINQSTAGFWIHPSFGGI